MNDDRLAAAQRGIALADVVSPGIAPVKVRTARAGAADRPLRSRVKRLPSKAASGLRGPLLSPGSLSKVERLKLVEGVERVIEGVFTHLPLKRARYGVDPVQRLRILRTQVIQFSDDEFHIELSDIVTRLRDAHTRYAGPTGLANKVAALPFLMEMFGPTASPTYVVTRVGAGLNAAFKPGVVIEFWNGVPMDKAVRRHGEQEVGGRPDSQRAWAVQSMTLRSLQYGPPPDEYWVVVGYRTTSSTGVPTGPVQEVRIDWRVIDPGDIDDELSGGPTGRSATRLRRARAINPAAAAIRRAKMLLFAPGALTGEQADSQPAPKSPSGRSAPKSQVIPTELTDTLKVLSIEAPGGPYGYLRIYGFDSAPEDFIPELVRLIPLLPGNGLIIDVRGNPGGYILAAETALQLFTPKSIQPTRFSLLATPFTRAMAELPALKDELAPWRTSLEASVRNGELYSQPIAISSYEECNAVGQQYGGPVVLVADSTTYSAGDLFSAGFVDNSLGPFVCVGEATGAGGANVWDYGDLQPLLVGSGIALPSLPDGIGLSFAFRRATRAGPSEGLPIEDVGINGASYAMTRDDLLAGNPDLLAHCIALFKNKPPSSLIVDQNKAKRTLSVTSVGLTRLGILFDGLPGGTVALNSRTPASVPYPAGTKLVELAGIRGDEVLQRRRIGLGR
jgi:Peptidase family S41